MKKEIVYLFLLAGLAGCGRRLGEWQRQENHNIRMEQQKTLQTKQDLRVEKDSAVLLPAPREESRSEGVDSSYLQTSLAWSVAVWKEGKLRHSIGNFPQIPSKLRVVYRERLRERVDTLIVRDTLWKLESRVTETRTKESAWKLWWSMSGKIALLIIAGYIAWRKFIRK